MNEKPPVEGWESKEAESTHVTGEARNVMRERPEVAEVASLINELHEKLLNNDLFVDKPDKRLRHSPYAYKQMLRDLLSDLL
ncbi:MAG: hypothetical protein AAB691_02070 [Patescibacteria group bacterium]